MPPEARQNRAPQGPTQRILRQLAEEAEELDGSNSSTEEQILRLVAEAPQPGTSTQAEQMLRLLAEAAQAGTSPQAEVPEAKLPEEPSAAEAESSS